MGCALALMCSLKIDQERKSRVINVTVDEYSEILPPMKKGGAGNSASASPCAIFQARWIRGSGGFRRFHEAESFPGLQGLDL
jgi:hypothetical protein